ncbi:MAG: hypothetical protein ACJZ5D_02045, partial [Candidatus Thalassarchaeaceae archaeon]
EEERVKETSRVCLVVSGQLRGYEEAMKSWEGYFKDLGEVDIFISTWDNPGFKSWGDMNLNTELWRILEEEYAERVYSKINEGGEESANALSQVKRSYLNHTSVSSNTELIEKKLRSLLSWGNSIEIELVEEGGDSFKKCLILRNTTSTTGMYSDD